MSDLAYSNTNIKRFFSEFSPRFSDFDLQGILNSRQYVDLLNEARFDQMNRCYNYPIENYVKKGLHWVTSQLSFDFKSPIYPGRVIKVYTEVKKIEGSRAFVEFSFETNSAGKIKIHAYGEAEYVLIDLATKTPIEISNEEKAIYL